MNIFRALLLIAGCTGNAVILAVAVSNPLVKVSPLYIAALGAIGYIGTASFFISVARQEGREQ